MNQKVLFWQKGDAKIFTKKVDVIDKAIKEGNSLNILKKKTIVYRK